jgi:hypothetical protein
VVYALGEAVERDSVAPAGGAFDNFLAGQREALRLAGLGLSCGQVADDLKSPVRVALGALELLPVHVGGMVALAPRTAAALDVMLAGRSAGPLFATRSGRRMDRHAALKVVRRLARTAGIEHVVSPHSLRHGFVTAALDADVPLRDVQDAAGHADPRTTRRYDRGRHSLDRAATYTVAAYLAT